MQAYFSETVFKPEFLLNRDSTVSAVESQEKVFCLSSKSNQWFSLTPEPGGGSTHEWFILDNPLHLFCSKLFISGLNWIALHESHFKINLLYYIMVLFSFSLFNYWQKWVELLCDWDDMLGISPLPEADMMGSAQPHPTQQFSVAE